MTDQAGFDEFYRAISPRVTRYAYAMTGDLPTAQDLTQEAFVRAWQRWRRVRDYDHAEAWLRLVVTRLATDRWRRGGVRRRVETAARPPEPAPAPSDDTVLLTTALRRIPVHERRALALHYLMDLSVADIAAETGVTVGTVKSRLSRGRHDLAKVLGTPATPGLAEETNDVR